MFDISNNGIITITRGDTASAPLFLNEGTKLNPIRYVLADTDKVYFGVSEAHCPFENALIRKVFTKDNLNENGDVVINFETKDTQCLLPNTYFYEIKLVRQIDEQQFVDTVVVRSKFVIME